MEGQPTQVERPWQTTARTLFQGAIAAALVLPLAVEAVGVDNLGPAAGWVGGAVVVAGAITRVMALPQVNDFLLRFLPFLAAGSK